MNYGYDLRSKKGEGELKMETKLRVTDIEVMQGNQAKGEPNQ
jgi:hypothetical protein